MKSRSTLILLALVVVVGGLVVLDHYKGTPTEDEQAKGRRLLRIEVADITRMELVGTNQTIVLEKSGDRWSITQPLAVRADDATISSILYELEFAERERTLTEKELGGVNLAEFGLAPPRLQAKLHGKNTDVTLLVGDDTPSKDALYVQVAGHKPVYVTRKSILDRLEVGLDRLRSRTAIEFTPSAATRFEIRAADRIIELAKVPATAAPAEQRWSITRPLVARADQRKVNDLLADLSALHIQQFVSEDPKDVHAYQLDGPQQELTVWSGDTGKTLLLGHSPTGEPAVVYAKLKSAESIFTVSADAARKFAVQINDLRDPRILEVADTDVYGMELLRGTTKTVLARTNDTWNVTAPVAIAAEQSVVRRLLTQLRTLAAKQFTVDVTTDLDRYGLAAPTATVTLLGQGTNVLTQLLVGGPDESQSMRYVKRADEPFVYGVESNIVEWLPSEYLAMRVHRLAELQPEQVKKVTIRKDGRQTVVERDAQDKWQLVEPAQGVLDLDALGQLVEAFASLSAEQFISDHHDNLAEYGLDTPGVTVTAQTADKTYSLTLGNARDEQQQYASWSDPTLILIVKPASAQPLTKDVVTAPLSAPAEAPPAAAPPTDASASPATAPPADAMPH